MANYKRLQVPKGEKITVANGQLKVPNKPIIAYLEGDGIGIDIWKPTRTVIDAAVKKAYGGQREIAWMEIYAGEKAQKVYGELLPEETFAAMREFLIGLKGPLTTPIGSGFRSLNVALRQVLDLYACIRPVKYMPGFPSPIKNPEIVDIVIFREAVEDIYAGIEWQSNSPEAKKLISFLSDNFKTKIDPASGVGIKPISPNGSKRLVRKAIQYALQYGRKHVTLVHKGNIMKYTEGAFMQWGYELAQAEFKDKAITTQELNEKYKGQIPTGKVVLNDYVADNMLQQLILRPGQFEVIAAPNLNGDYLSEVAAALVGGIGVAPGGNIGDYMALFEPTHGTAPLHAGKNDANPSSQILSACMMLDYMGWPEASAKIKTALEKTIQQKKVTYDLARQMQGATLLTSSAFGEAVAANL
ncbi:isocitrate dehydrogenase (NADP(+)) [Candidatus Acetothermia bacterium]|nr:isocitrate dehydrogenase (NADP(+)) [Candidatus Acetothermia bacterium]